jgi:hypothetical protein
VLQAVVLVTAVAVVRHSPQTRFSATPTPCMLCAASLLVLQAFVYGFICAAPCIACGSSISDGLVTSWCDQTFACLCFAFGLAGARWCCRCL